MPSGIVMSSSSVGATQEAIEKVLTDHGYETDKPEVEPVEPKPEEIEAEEVIEEQKEEAAETEAKRPSRKQRLVDRVTRELREQNRKLEERLAKLEGNKAASRKQRLPSPSVTSSNPTLNLKRRCLITAIRYGAPRKSPSKRRTQPSRNSKKISKTISLQSPTSKKITTLGTK